MENMNEAPKYGYTLQLPLCICPYYENECELLYKGILYILHNLQLWLMELPLCLSLFVLICIRLDGNVQVLLHTSPFPSGRVDILISAGRGNVWQTPRLLVYLYH